MSEVYSHEVGGQARFRESLKFVTFPPLRNCQFPVPVPVGGGVIPGKIGLIGWQQININPIPTGLKYKNKFTGGGPLCNPPPEDHCQSTINY